MKRPGVHLDELSAQEAVNKVCVTANQQGIAK